jgi:peptidoglycan/xylan/chitin deacetylase (PgdA/CDA1 family)
MSQANGRYRIVDLSGLKNRKIACLTLDLEQDYGDLLDEPSYEGLNYIPRLVELLSRYDLPLTCFVQGSLFETHPTTIRQLLTLDVEFELHAYSHLRPKEIDHELEMRKGKGAFTKFFGKEPLAYRSPLGVVSEEMFSLLQLHGFRFDSSLVPSFRPGVYSNLTKPTSPYFLNDSDIIEFPGSVFSKVIRIPISLSYVKLLGKPYLSLLKRKSLPHLIVFGFHLHDLFELSSSSRIPVGSFSPTYRLVFNKLYRGRKSNGYIMLDEVIAVFREKGYTFSKLVDVYGSIS